MSKRSMLCGCLLLGALSAGCSKGWSFSDDEGGHASGSGGDALSQPYARGTKIRITVENVNETTWQLKSDTPATFSVDKVTIDKGTLTADCSAPAEGQATLALSDGSGKVVHSALVAVKVPDRAVILAHGPARLLGHNPSSTTLAEVTSARILTGARAVFMVGYFRGNERLYGHGLATTTATGTTLTVTNNTSSGGPISEWLFLTATSDGDYTVQITPGGTTIGTLAVTAVADAEIATLDVGEEVGHDQKDGTRVWVLAQARDSMGRAIYGAYSTWTLDGATQTNGSPSAINGDFFRYNYKAGPTKDLVATHGGKTGTFKITAGDGSVGDTTYLGCNVAGPPDAAHALAFLIAIGLPCLLLLRRRRAAA